jgi:uncharacterized protein (TIGR03435 family)
MGIKVSMQILALAASSASAILAQNTTADITGTWQGTMHSSGKEFRSVYKITRTDDGQLKAVYYSLDQGAIPFAAKSVVMQASTVKISVPSIEGELTGKLSLDGATITGEWVSSGMPFPLTLTRATPETAWTIPSPSAHLERMQPDASPTFEVATIKPSDPTYFSSGFKIANHRVYAVRENLRALIMFAYGVHPRQITGGPDWADSDFYDINGQPDQPGVPDLDQMRTMYRKLLTERFHLTCHRDKKELPVYILMLGKNGHKLTPSANQLSAIPDQTIHRRGFLTERNATMPDFAGMLQSSMLDRPVIDQTGLTGRFDFALQWTPDQQSSGTAKTDDDSSAPPDLFAAIQQQLGLKLEAARQPADVLVIDWVERPSEN